MKGEIKMFMMEVKPYSIIEKIMNGDSVFYYDKEVKTIEEVNLNFMMEKLSIEFKVSTDEDVEEIMDEVRKLVKKLEPDAVIS